MKNELKIVADNGGGITLQVVSENGYQYQHHYSEVADAARDAALIENGADVSDWEGNEVDVGFSPGSEEVSNGGYKVTTAQDLLAADLEELCWNNLREMAQALQRNSHQTINSSGR